MRTKCSVLYLVIEACPGKEKVKKSVAHCVTLYRFHLGVFTSVVTAVCTKTMEC